ncbi:MAG: D-aminoacyl-tRNA deacylase [Anaerolineaceae bacterium]|nr:D-aminoacyl-tRNA deacylase [Anaerolineaceae bacterium]
MRFVLQRVPRGEVHVAGELVGAIDEGLVALVGIAQDDGPAGVDRLAQKTAQLRIFRDDQHRMNRSALDLGYGVLVISQFTLYADMKRGRRPGFTRAGKPEMAAALVERYAEKLREAGIEQVACGVFGADMQVVIHNDGPVTLILDSAEM